MPNLRLTEFFIVETRKSSKNKAVRKRLEYVVLTTNDKKIMQHNSVTIGKDSGSLGSDSLERYVIFVARGKHPIISFANYFRAEHLAIIFARLTNTRMEVFDSNKELCYFVEPSEIEQSFIHKRFE